METFLAYMQIAVFCASKACPINCKPLGLFVTIEMVTLFAWEVYDSNYPDFLVVVNFTARRPEICFGKIFAKGGTEGGAGKQVPCPVYISTS